MSYVEAVASSRLPPPKGALVCGNCIHVCCLSDGAYLCTLRSKKYNMVYLRQGEAEPACSEFSENMLLDLARTDIEYETDEPAKPKR